MRTILDTHGYVVLETDSGKDAAKICEQHQRLIHFLLTNVLMPGMREKECGRLHRTHN